MLDIFKDIMNHSTHPIDESNLSTQNLKGELKPRYVISIVLEFLRTLLENSIP